MVGAAALRALEKRGRPKATWPCAIAWIAAGEYTNDSECIRDLVRRDHEENSKFLALNQAIQEGLGSGVSDQSVTDIMEEVEARLRADGRL